MTKPNKTWRIINLIGLLEDASLDAASNSEDNNAINIAQELRIRLLRQVLGREPVYDEVKSIELSDYGEDLARFKQAVNSNASPAELDALLDEMIKEW